MLTSFIQHEVKSRHLAEGSGLWTPEGGHGCQAHSRTMARAFRLVIISINSTLNA